MAGCPVTSALASVADGTPVVATSAILTTDASGIVLSVDQGCCELFGHSLEELLGHNVTRIIPSPYADQHGQYMQNYLRTGKKRIIGKSRTVQGLHKNGETFNISLSISAVKRGANTLFVAAIDKLGETGVSFSPFLPPFFSLISLTSNSSFVHFRPRGQKKTTPPLTPHPSPLTPNHPQPAS
jgi:PAS domain S-box-containing protein